MSYYEYMVMPAPKTAPRAKGVRGADGRLALALTELMNRHGSDGWEYQRSENLTVELREGLFRRPSVSVETVLVFRRWVETESPGDARMTPLPAGLAAAPPQNGFRHDATPEVAFEHTPRSGDAPRLSAVEGARPGSGAAPNKGEGRPLRAEPQLRPMPGQDRG